MKRKLIALLLLIAVLALLFLAEREEHAALSNEPKGQESDAETAIDSRVTVTPTFAAITVRRESVVSQDENGISVRVSSENGPDVLYCFSDVPADSWYVKAVDFAVSSGLMTGVDDGNGRLRFRPDYGVTRAEFAALLFDFFEGETEKAAHVYADVSENNPYYESICWVTEKGLLLGDADGYFLPDDFFTCRQALIVLYRIAGEPECSGTLSDYPYASKVPEYCEDAFNWAWNTGLIEEEECLWYPTQDISRAQIALLLLRYSELLNG